METKIYVIFTITGCITAIFSSFRIVNYVSENDEGRTVIDFIMRKKIRLLGSFCFGFLFSAITLFIDDRITAKSILFYFIISVLLSFSWYIGTSLGMSKISKNEGFKE